MENLDLYIGEIKMLSSMLDGGRVNTYEYVESKFNYCTVYIGDLRFIFEHKKEEFVALYIRKFNDIKSELFKTVSVVRNENKVIEEMHKSFTWLYI